jgi:hypothetical protein
MDKIVHSEQNETLVKLCLENGAQLYIILHSWTWMTEEINLMFVSSRFIYTLFYISVHEWGKK